jgi:hypothetical protein
MGSDDVFMDRGMTRQVYRTKTHTQIILKVIVNINSGFLLDLN